MDTDLLMRDMVLHLDRQIELTLEALKKIPGVELAFAPAHGAPDHDTTDCLTARIYSSFQWWCGHRLGFGPDRARCL